MDSAVPMPNNYKHDPARIDFCHLLYRFLATETGILLVFVISFPVQINAVHEIVKTRTPFTDASRTDLSLRALLHL